MRYAFLEHRRSHETWAAKIDETGHVAGLCGPLLSRNISNSLLPEYEYELDGPLLDDVTRHLEEFVVGLLSDAAV